MAQYVFTMNRVGKIVPPKRQILNQCHSALAVLAFDCQYRLKHAILG